MVYVLSVFVCIVLYLTVQTHETSLKTKSWLQHMRSLEYNSANPVRATAHPLSPARTCEVSWPPSSHSNCNYNMGMYHTVQKLQKMSLQSAINESSQITAASASSDVHTETKGTSGASVWSNFFADGASFTSLFVYFTINGHHTNQTCWTFSCCSSCLLTEKTQ